MNKLSAVGEDLQSLAHLRGILEYSGEPRNITVDAEALAPDLGQNRKGRFIGDVVSDENRHAAGKWRMGHQPADTLPFADTWTLDFEHGFAKQQFGWLAGKCRAAFSHVPPQPFSKLWRFPVVQCE